jgi:hypothetical protein
MKDLKNVISLAELTGDGKSRVLTGKERGIAARAALHLDEMDKSPDTIIVEVPTYLSAISSSYFLGLFSRSVRLLGSEDAFLKKYDFKASAVILDHIRNGIRNALIDRGSITGR